MTFFIMCQNIMIAMLYCNTQEVKYKIFFENLTEAKKLGLIINPILECSYNGTLPNWIEKRIPQNEPNKLEYLAKTQSRLETDNIWFDLIKN